MSHPRATILAFSLLICAVGLQPAQAKQTRAKSYPRSMYMQPTQAQPSVIRTAGPTTVVHTVRRPTAQTDAAFNAYLDRLRAKLLHSWTVPDGKNHVVVTSTVGIDGSVTEVSVTSTPSNAVAEQAASDSFHGAQPLESLPNGHTASRLTCTFDSNADPHGDFTSNVGLHMDPIMLKQETPQTPPSSN